MLLQTRFLQCRRLKHWTKTREKMRSTSRRRYSTSHSRCNHRAYREALLANMGAYTSSANLDRSLDIQCQAYMAKIGSRHIRTAELPMACGGFGGLHWHVLGDALFVFSTATMMGKAFSCTLTRNTLCRPLKASSIRHRAVSTYGYAQAKCLIYPRPGAIPDVLEY